MELDRDRWVGRKMSSTTIQEPSSDELAAAIKSLDQATFTQVTLTHGAEYLSISGGRNAFLVFLFTEDETNMIASTPDRASMPPTTLVAGGQRILLPAEQVVGLEDALRIAEIYRASQKLCDKTTWIVD